MSPRKVFPRPAAHHESRAAEVLRAYASAFAWSPSLPIPIEPILERMFDLRITWGPLEEDPGERVLGALDPTTKTVHMNEKHLPLFVEVLGPERFTLAHELGHWVYDAESPEQLTLDVEAATTIYCRDTRSQPASDQAAIREINANKFAACLLLPADLVRGALVASEGASLARIAADCGVSKATLRIRAEDLGLGHLLQPS